MHHMYVCACLCIWTEVCMYMWKPEDNLTCQLSVASGTMPSRKAGFSETQELTGKLPKAHSAPSPVLSRRCPSEPSLGMCHHGGPWTALRAFSISALCPAHPPARNAHPSVWGYLSTCVSHLHQRTSPQPSFVPLKSGNLLHNPIKECLIATAYMWFCSLEKVIFIDKNYR